MVNWPKLPIAFVMESIVLSGAGLSSEDIVGKVGRSSSSSCILHMCCCLKLTMSRSTVSILEAGSVYRGISTMAEAYEGSKPSLTRVLLVVPR